MSIPEVTEGAVPGASDTSAGLAHTPRGRATWSGLLRLSLVSVPIKAYPAAVSHADSHLHQLHAGCRHPGGVAGHHVQGLARKEPAEKLLSEVLDRPVATGQLLRFPAGHAVRADRASLKSAFVITHVRRGGAAWRVQGRLEFGSKDSLADPAR